VNLCLVIIALASFFITSHLKCEAWSLTHTVAVPKVPNHAVKVSTTKSAVGATHGLSHTYPDKSSLQMRMYSSPVEDLPPYR
jgi:hypothetical protein